MATVFGLILGFIAAPLVLKVALGLFQFLGLYTTVYERTCKVYVFFGNVVAVLDEPGFQFLWPHMGWRSLFVNWLGRCHTLDLRLDQQYLRSLPVNSEEGAPMGVGVWYEMSISDPIKYLFENADPKGSLAANVSNATIRCLSNMKLSDMLETRHTMSRAVRTEVSPTSHAWGYRLGSVYIRKVHLRDGGMIRQIEEKVVNRLRQVTSAIRQDGANQVSIIASTADRQAAVEFAKAKTLRPQIVGHALERIGKDSEVLEAMFDILEVERLAQSDTRLALVPEGQGSGLMTGLLATGTAPAPSALPPRLPERPPRGTPGTGV